MITSSPSSSMMYGKLSVPIRFNPVARSSSSDQHRIGIMTVMMIICRGKVHLLILYNRSSASATSIYLWGTEIPDSRPASPAGGPNPSNLSAMHFPNSAFAGIHRSHDDPSIAHAKIITIAHQNMDGWAHDHAHRSAYKYVGRPSGWLNCVYILSSLVHTYYISRTHDPWHSCPVLPHPPSIRQAVCPWSISIRSVPRYCSTTATTSYPSAWIA